jgi:hypothetical protein
VVKKVLDEARSLGPIDRTSTTSANWRLMFSLKETHNAAFLAGGTQSYSQDVTGFKSRPAPDTGEMGRPTE